MSPAGIYVGEPKPLGKRRDSSGGEIPYRGRSGRCSLPPWPPWWHCHREHTQRQTAPGGRSAPEAPVFPGCVDECAGRLVYLPRGHPIFLVRGFSFSHTRHRHREEQNFCHCRFGVRRFPQNSHGMALSGPFRPFDRPCVGNAGMTSCNAFLCPSGSRLARSAPATGCPLPFTVSIRAEAPSAGC